LSCGHGALFRVSEERDISLLLTVSIAKAIKPVVTVGAILRPKVLPRKFRKWNQGLSKAINLSARKEPVKSTITSGSFQPSTLCLSGLK
jgi:hypothetical protein